MIKYKTILFDLDGTITDSAQGIINCIKYAVTELGYESGGDHLYEKYIGPSLKNSFFEILETDDENLADRAMALYRKRYEEKGIYENKLYPGIKDTLNSLNELGFTLFLATAKPEVYAKEVIRHFSLEKFFKKIYGSELDGTRVDKAELIHYILEKEQLDTNATIMVGDRENDILGAKSNNLDSLAVMYGYGRKEEIYPAAPTYISRNTADIIEIVKSGGRWEPISPHEIFEELKNSKARWWIAGGYALDLFLGKETRPHDDIDISVPRSDQKLIRDFLRDWKLFACDPPGTLRFWNGDETLPDTVQDVWCRKKASADWNMQIIFFDTDGDDWVFKRNEQIKKPIEDFGTLTSEGIPIINPEIQLLYKAASKIREKDEQDLENCLPHLSPTARQWLASAIRSTLGNDHPWLRRLTL